MEHDQALPQGSLAIAPPPALGKHVLDELRRRIITGELAVGTHLVEKRLSQTFDVSRGPIRDALRQLETEGLVESRRRGVYVIGLTTEDLAELYSLRQVLEAEAVRLCMNLETGIDATDARHALDQMRDAAENSDPVTFASADLAFHSSFYAQSGHRRLASFWEQYRPTFADMLGVTNTVDGDLRPTYRDHEDLLRIIQTGEVEQVMPKLRTHIEGSHDRMLAAYRRYLATV